MVLPTIPTFASLAPATLLAVVAALAPTRAAAQSVLFDFDNAPLYASLPLDVTAGGITAHLSATGQGYSIQSTSTSPVVPIGFKGRFVYPNSVFAADLIVDFSRTLAALSILYAPHELGCDDSARMRVTAYMQGVPVGSNTMTARKPGTWPVETLACSFPQGFDRVVIHYDAPPPTCRDYGVIFLADDMNVTVATPASFVAYGSGCAGSAGIPALAPSPGSLPWIGNTFTAQLTNLATTPVLELPVMLCGASNAAWGSYALPLDLTPIGMQGCTLHASAQLAFGLANVGGAATWSTRIPRSGALVGASLFVQATVLSPGANALGVVMSNAGEMRVGVK